MENNQTFIGSHKASFESNTPEGELVYIDNHQFYKISDVDQMRPFLMSLLSDSNHWMFISSNGGLSAGRKDSDQALFPYYTDDKITDSVETTGSKTIFRVLSNNQWVLWEPFSYRYKGIYKCSINLYKSTYGNQIIFEEVNNDLGLLFKYQWSTSNKYGFIRKSSLLNTAKNSTKVSFIDGIQNIVPSGVSAELNNNRSNLVDAYKKNELESKTGLGIYSLSSIIVDKAEPSEALKATTVWSAGLEHPKYLICSNQVNNFRRNGYVNSETEIRAERGAYLLSDVVELEVGEAKEWNIIANVNQSGASVINLSTALGKRNELIKDVNLNIQEGTKELLKLVSAADGLQKCQDDLINARHFSNTVFNIMRGGIFDNNYQIEKWDFLNYLKNANALVYSHNDKVINSLPDIFSTNDLRNVLRENADPDFKRLCIEYLPLKFSRRHGDPSRPWNKFFINTRSEIDGSKILDYEGNWRDIFQNWEALVHSYPSFIEGMIFKFLNATTFDGYNPYRVTKGGFDWEVIEPNDPWSYIGYWGDHQIIYLLKLLEFSEKIDPDQLSIYFKDDVFVYANVPYRIKPYAEIVNNPKDTIEFDLGEHHEIIKKRNKLGADGALLKSKNESIYKVNLIEKLLATVLCKLSNFVPEGGIWMNTQRPEWNDANNALVGNGVSVVTLCYLRRFLNFMQSVVNNTHEDGFNISEEFYVFLNNIESTFEKNVDILEHKISAEDRKRVVDSLGEAGSQFRNTIYNNHFTGEKITLAKSKIQNFLLLVQRYLDHSIEANRRSDNLYHAYNLLSIDEKGIHLSYLSEMLEGQVAILSAGVISASESLEILNSLRKSALYRIDQQSYILYPDKDLGIFMMKNKIDKAEVLEIDLLRKMIEDGNRSIIESDITDVFHFNANFRNSNDIVTAISELVDPSYQLLIEKDLEKILALYERYFNHKEFTGRSGTFFGYEGLGSIYWHMVSKLLLAVQECIHAAIKEKENPAIIQQFKNHYYEIRDGIGVHKSPLLYGAIPIDPYSHTPAGKGAQQPGMTGQVKEDILCRIGELGIKLNHGRISFHPSLLKVQEYLNDPTEFNYVNLDGAQEVIRLNANALGFTFCQVPVVYNLSDQNIIKLYLTQGDIVQIDDLELNQEISNDVINRTGKVRRIDVFTRPA